MKVQQLFAFDVHILHVITVGGVADMCGLASRIDIILYYVIYVVILVSVLIMRMNKLFCDFIVIVKV